MNSHKNYIPGRNSQQHDYAAASRTRQSGVVLFVSVIMLVVIGMLSMSLMGMSRIEMRMANNEEARINGLQIAQAVIDLAAFDPDITPVVGGADYTLCASVDSDGCDVMVTNRLPANDVKTEVTEGSLHLYAIRSDPPIQNPPRYIETDLTNFEAAPFRLRGVYDRTADGQGYAAVEQGVVVMVKKL
jgi:hypothetical protein